MYYLYGIANRTLGCEREILALMGVRHLISPDVAGRDVMFLSHSHVGKDTCTDGLLDWRLYQCCVDDRLQNKRGECSCEWARPIRAHVLLYYANTIQLALFQVSSEAHLCK